MLSVPRGSFHFQIVCFHLFKCPHDNSINRISEGRMFWHYSLWRLLALEVLLHIEMTISFSIVRLAMMSKAYKNRRRIWMWQTVVVYTNVYLGHAVHSLTCSVVQFGTLHWSFSVLSDYLSFLLCAARCTDGLFFWTNIDSVVVSVIKSSVFLCVSFFFSWEPPYIHRVCNRILTFVCESAFAYMSDPWKFGQRKSNSRPLRIVSLNTGENFVIKISEILLHWASSGPGLIKSIAAVAAVVVVSVCPIEPPSTGPHGCFSSPAFYSGPILVQGEPNVWSHSFFFPFSFLFPGPWC